jgi:RecA-family ATPase
MITGARTWRDDFLKEAGETSGRNEQEKLKLSLPAPEDISELISRPILLPDDVIKGILSEGGKMVCGGASKAFKTWLFIDLGTAVVAGTEFMGFATKQGKVLYINFELQPEFFSYRVKTVVDYRKTRIPSGSFDVWNLRGHARELSLLLPSILAQAGKGKYRLVILDPIYKVLGGRQENLAHDVTAIVNELEEIAVQSGAAVVFGAHFSKGNQAQKESIDRISGHGGWNRDPDCILTFTRHEEEDCFTVEATLRNHPPILPFVMRWTFPVMVRDDELDPENLKQPRGAPRKASLNQLLSLLDDEPLRSTPWQEKAKEDLNIGSSTFYSMKKELEKLGCIFQVAGLYSRMK